MLYHAFNIGKPYTDAWWLRNRRLGVITAGFDGRQGDRGDKILRKMSEGDWVLAYASRHGYVGAGLVGPLETYRLLDISELPSGFESSHRHLRDVHWVYTVDQLREGISSSEVGRSPPRQTTEIVYDDVAKRLIGLLATRSGVEMPVISFRSHDDHFAAAVRARASDNAADRRQRLLEAQKVPPKIPVVTYVFDRNPDVVAEVLDRAKGQCENCKSAAPFLRRRDQTPYLEVHHRKQLALGGEDTVENSIALCPNCHREMHYG